MLGSRRQLEGVAAAPEGGVDLPRTAQGRALDGVHLVSPDQADGSEGQREPQQDERDARHHQRRAHDPVPHGRSS